MKIKIDRDDYSSEVDIYSKEGLKLIAELWMKVSCQYKLMYEPTWLGRPIIQYPNDIIMMQELIWEIKPDVIIETGVAHGGSAVFFASILELSGKGKVISIDLEIRQHNKTAIKNHPLSKRITLIEGNSVDKNIIKKVHSEIRDDDKVLVVLDSDHSYKHVLKEIKLYSRMVPFDSYIVVMDGLQGLVWDIPSGKKEWQNDNPLRAIKEFLKRHPEWEVDQYYNRLHVTSNPCGFLRRINSKRTFQKYQKKCLSFKL